MLKGIVMQIYPNQKQKEQLYQMFGNDRFVWNKMLQMANKRYENNPTSQFINAYAMCYLLKPLKQEYPFLKDSDSSSLQIVIGNLDQAFQRLFKKQGGHPKFHSRKYDKPSYTGKSTIQIVAKRYLKIPKLGYIKSSKTGRLLNGKIKRYTLSYLPTGKYQLSVIMECDSQTFQKTGQKIGIDLGLHDLMILSNGIKYKKYTTKYLDNEAKQWQRKMAHRKNRATISVRQWNYNHDVNHSQELEDYINWQRAKQIKVTYQDKAKRKRNMYLQQITTNLVKNYDVIVMEDLKVQNMMKNHHLADSIAHACWRKIRDMLTYKCQWYGKQLIVVNPCNTSRVCHHCHHLQEQFKGMPTNEWLNTRQWYCEKCGILQDRDINAANNILQLGLKDNN